MGANKWLIVSLLAFFLTAGSFLGIYTDRSALSWQGEMDVLPMSAVGPTIDRMETALLDAGSSLGLFQTAVASQANADKAISDQLAALARKSSSNKNLSDQVYEEMIVSRLGKAKYVKNGTNAKIQIFELNKEDLRGYMAKVTVKTDAALRVTLNSASKATGETTLQACKRLEGLLAINGGGFATSKDKNGKSTMQPLGNTMIGGKLVGDFQASWNDLAFAGFSKSGKLVGGIYTKKQDLLDSGAWQGVSFVPELIRNWEPSAIPAKWAKAKQPRTVLGQYPNGDLIFIVVDGRQSNWSNGITLEEMQILLLHLGVMEAFNLDGGGSSAFVYNGKVLNKPSDGKLRPLATNIVIIP